MGDRDSGPDFWGNIYLTNCNIDDNVIYDLKTIIMLSIIDVIFSTTDVIFSTTNVIFSTRIANLAI